MCVPVFAEFCSDGEFADFLNTKKSRIFLVSVHTLIGIVFFRRIRHFPPTFQDSRQCMKNFFKINPPPIPAYLVLGEGVTAEAGGKYRGDGIGELD
jgi:hypothetical protein